MPSKGAIDGTERGKNGSKIHLICERNGLSISVAISGANLHDSQALDPLVPAIPHVRFRSGPRRRRPAERDGDKDYDRLRPPVEWLRARGIVPRIARRGVESPSRLGRHRWVLKRTMSWLPGCRRPSRRYERKSVHFMGFVGIAVMFICLRRLGVTPGR